MTTDACLQPKDEVQEQWVGVGRALGGAIIFTMPVMLTMEIWTMAFYVHPSRLLWILLVSFPVFVKISSLIGFTESRKLFDNVVDVFVAYTFGFLIATLALLLFGVTGPNDSVSVNIAAVTLIAIPASLGALLGRSELGSGEHSRKPERKRIDEMAILSVGALYLAFNIAPTDEIIQVSHHMSAWQLLVMFLATLGIMYIFAGCCSYQARQCDSSRLRLLVSQLCYTSMAFLVAFTISLFLLWGFDQTGDLSWTEIVACTVVLLLPAGVGAAAAHFII